MGFLGQGYVLTLTLTRTLVGCKQTIEIVVESGCCLNSTELSTRIRSAENLLLAFLEFLIFFKCFLPLHRREVL